MGDEAPPEKVSAHPTFGGRRSSIPPSPEAPRPPDLPAPPEGLRTPRWRLGVARRGFATWVVAPSQIVQRRSR
jgi:hypothetical protein